MQNKYNFMSRNNLLQKKEIVRREKKETIFTLSDLKGQSLT